MMLFADNSSVEHGGEDSLHRETPARPQVSYSMDCCGGGRVGRCAITRGRPRVQPANSQTEPIWSSNHTTMCYQ